MTDNLDNTQKTTEGAAPEDLNIKDHFKLFQTQEYKDLFARKREFEGAYSPEQIAETAEWTKSWDYREKNFAREA